MTIIFFILKKVFAKLQNEHAFTLVEMLFAFWVFTIIIFFISPLLSGMVQHHATSKRLQEMEWDVFSSQIKKEIRMSTKGQVVNNRLILTEDIGSVTFEKYDNILRRRVNNTGHEVLLQNVAEVNFSLLPNTVRVEVTDLNQIEHIVNVATFLNWSGNP
ncbi:MAG: competence type IV pilus minor pilin ComGF [Bacillota bacterium]|nr:competence type IV pilus minor pilin ComGF [Bacillota bacterium]